MKKLMCCLVLISLASCGKSVQKKDVDSESENFQASEQAAVFGLPKINFQRTITVDRAISSDYEGLSINPNKEIKVLGDEAFYVSISSNMYPSYDEMEVEFYDQTAVKSIKYFDSKIILSKTDMTIQQLTTLKLKEVGILMKNKLSWGVKNLDNPEYDMQNKGYVIRTEEMRSEDGKEFKATSTYLMWFDCFGTVSAVDDLAYACTKYNLKFHYKLLDYVLTSEKI